MVSHGKQDETESLGRDRQPAERAEELETITKFQQRMIGDVDARLMVMAIIQDLRRKAAERLRVCPSNTA